MLGRRLIAAAIIISIVLVLLWIDFQIGQPSWLARPGLVLAVLTTAIAALAAAELAKMLQRESNPVPTWLPVTGSTLMIGTACIRLIWTDYPANCPIGNFGWSTLGLVEAIVLTFVYEMLRFKGENEGDSGVVIDRMSRCFFIYGYLGMLLAFFVPHRLLEGDNAIGLIAIISLIATVKLSDSFAYFAGKTLGSRKIAPKLSPKKTLEGAIGAIIGGWVAAAIMIFVVAPYVFEISALRSTGWVFLYGTLVTLAGMMGDLAESLIKRDSGCKDSSSWLPGLGGILDIADSMIFAAPVSFVLWLVS